MGVLTLPPILFQTPGARIRSGVPSNVNAVANEVPEENSRMKIRPLHDRVIVRREEDERKSPGGIVIPDTATEKPIRGKVLAVGKGKILEGGDVRPLDVKIGDKVLFGKYSGTEVKVDGEDLLVMREEDIMAIIESK
jgi:chaperonin GroES